MKDFVYLHVEAFEMLHYVQHDTGLFHFIVGAGFARPNTSTALFVGAFGQANPAPIGIFIHLAF